jgi:hypothetical protein
MANDLELYDDADHAAGRERKLLFDCYYYRYVVSDAALAEKAKQAYIAEFKHWPNYY